MGKTCTLGVRWSSSGFFRRVRLSGVYDKIVVRIMMVLTAAA